jgi:lysyl-tRNA synthetase class 2
MALFEKGPDSSQDISLAGRIMSKRSIGKMCFMDIRDSSGKIQLSLRYDLLGPEKYEFLQDVDIGDIVGAKGRLFKTKSGELTLEVSDFAMLAKSIRPLPEKWHGLADVEKRYRQRYLDLISNEENRNVFVLRSKIITAVRSFLDSRGFMEVETPVLQPHAGGALARPFVTHHHALDEDLYLRIALELHLKRLVIGGLDKVYEIGRVFRNEGISVEHNPEFTLLECYQAYSDYEDVMQLVEDMLRHVAETVLGDARLVYNNKVVDLGLRWQRLYLREAVRQYCDIDFEEHPDAASLKKRMIELGMDVDPAKGKGRLIEDLLSTYVEPHLTQPTFLVDYPVEMSPLAKRKPGDDQLVERFEGFVDGMEVANAFTELNDPLEQRERFEQQRKERAGGDEEAEIGDEDFLRALEYGMPPTGGLGIGIDRLVMLLTGQQSIREVILFPQLKTKE